MTEDYTTLTNIKELFPDTTLSTDYNTLIRRLITRASRSIDSYLKRPPGWFAVADETTLYFQGTGNLELWVGELASIPSYIGVAETGDIDDASDSGGTYTTYATSDYIVWPDNALARKDPILRLDLNPLGGSKYTWYKYPKAVKITAYHGFTTTSNMPDDIAMACEIEVMRLFKRSQQAFRDVGANTKLGQLQYSKGMDPQAKEYLDQEKFQWL